LPVGYIYPKEQRAVRDLLRERRRLVQQRATHVLSTLSRDNQGEKARQSG
jgi:hypothetical protein